MTGRPSANLTSSLSATPPTGRSSSWASPLTPRPAGVVVTAPAPARTPTPAPRTRDQHRHGHRHPHAHRSLTMSRRAEDREGALRPPASLRSTHPRSRSARSCGRSGRTPPRAVVDGRSPGFSPRPPRADGGGDLALQGRRRRGPGAPRLRAVPGLAAAYVGLTVLQALLGWADRMLSTWLTQRFLVDLRSELLAPPATPPSRLLHPVATGRPDGPGRRRRLRDRVVPGVRHQPRAHAPARAGLFTVALFWLDPLLAVVSLVVTPLSG